MGGINTTGDGKDRDCDGHGTHVASTLGGLEYGVAKNVDIVAVKVLGCDGTGSTTGIIQGVDWAMKHAANNGISNKSVANMSLGGGFSQSLNTAVKNLHESGVLTAVAAGNNNVNACSKSPASEPAVITVGSTTSTDARSSFSNYGSCLDIFAPGSEITAAWIGNDSSTITISGTSMASPHVAGGLAIAIAEGSTDAEGTVLNNATMSKVTDRKTGSPNKLLYVGNVLSEEEENQSSFFKCPDQLICILSVVFIGLISILILVERVLRLIYKHKLEDGRNSSLLLYSVEKVQISFNSMIQISHI